MTSREYCLIIASSTPFGPCSCRPWSCESSHPEADAHASRRSVIGVATILGAITPLDLRRGPLRQLLSVILPATSSYSRTLAGPFHVSGHMPPCSGEKNEHSSDTARSRSRSKRQMVENRRQELKTTPSDSS
ncbi:hypothetical protein LZ32DRAFT_131864 [Colletotrichum eremochloae]|nr:hypothetical protein LZ32DRAFT_131864 [Colletotrichum eremochloae]